MIQTMELLSQEKKKGKETLRNTLLGHFLKGGFSLSPKIHTLK
jgi:hypothetical protein